MCPRMWSGGHWGSLVWRSGLCDWSRGCMPTARSHVRVGDGYSEEFEVKVGVSPRLGTQPTALHHCAWSLYADDLVIIADSFEECVRRFLIWKKKQWWRKGLRVKCRKDEGHDLWYRSEPPAEFRRVPMCCLSHWSRQQQHLLQQLQNTGCTRNAVGSSAWQRTLITGVQRSRELPVP